MRGLPRGPQSWAVSIEREGSDLSVVQLRVEYDSRGTESHRWDIVVIDRSHKLRNAYRHPAIWSGKASNGQPKDLSQTIADCHAPQNSLLELFGVVVAPRRATCSGCHSFRSSTRAREAILKLSGSGFRPSATALRKPGHGIYPHTERTTPHFGHLVQPMMTRPLLGGFGFPATRKQLALPQRQRI